MKGAAKLSTIQGDQAKYDRAYFLYGENYFAPEQREMCAIFSAPYRLAKTACL